MLEEKELLMQAQPIESRQGSNVWQMSLRDAWTRYIAVGGPFSGLEMPYIDRPELRPDSIYTIRNPFNNTEQYANELCLDPKTGQPATNPKTKQPYTRRDLGVTVHPSLNLDKVRPSRLLLLMYIYIFQKKFLSPIFCPGQTKWNRQYAQKQKLCFQPLDLRVSRVNTSFKPHSCKFPRFA